MACFVCFSLSPICSVSQVALSKKITVRQVVCPKVCLGESTYKIAFSLPIGASLLPESGTVAGDSIVGIRAFPSNKVKIKVTFADASVRDTTINLPICDPFIPSEPLVTSEIVCRDSAIPALVAFAQPAVVVDWYDSPTGGNQLAVAKDEFLPQNVGSYYAQSRVVESGCVSQTRGRGSVAINEASKKCLEVTTTRRR